MTFTKRPEFDDSRSRAAIAGHPIHPFLVSVPVTMLVTAAVSDMLYASTHDAYWARTSRWLLRAGVVSGGVAAPFGLTDFLTIPAARSGVPGWIHLLGNAAGLGLASANLAMRRDRPVPPILPTGLALSTATACLLLVTAWFGGEMAYRQGIGVGAGGVRVPQEPQTLWEARRRRQGRARGGKGAGVPVMAGGSIGSESPDLLALRGGTRAGEEE